MKYSLILFKIVIILSISQFSILAQTKQKQFLVGGQYSLDFSSNKSTFNGSNNSYESGKSRSLQIAPQVGYFFLRNTAVGLEFLYHFEKEFGQEYLGYANYNYEKSFSIIPFLRYYFGHGILKPYLHTGIGPGWVKTGSKNYNFPEFTQKSKILFYELRGGLGIFINEHISFDIGVGYEFTKQFYKESMIDGSYDEWNTIRKGIGTTVGIVICI